MLGERVKMVAHRGFNLYETENTCAAFVAAGNRSHFGIETDIHVTRDGEFVIIHDDRTGRVAGDDLCVEETCLETLRGIRLLDKDGKKGRKDLMMPVLAEYLSICKRYGKTAVLEFKNHFSPEDTDRVIELIRSMDYMDRMVFISFDLPNMICLREKLPEAKLQFLTKVYTDDLEETLQKYRLDLDIKHVAITKERVSRLHELGIEVNVWTVDTEELAERMIDYGVDYITTNCLE